MTAKTLKALVAATLVVVLIFAFGVSASAEFVDDFNSDMTGDLTGLHLYSLVTKEGSIYTYTYTLTYDVGTSNVAHEFAVENPFDLEYTNSSNNKQFTNLPYNPYNYWVTWTSGNLAPGDSAVFSYQSVYAPGPEEIPVYAYVINGGSGSNGFALGMATAIPEPGALAGLAIPLTGFGLAFYRRRR